MNQKVRIIARSKEFEQAPVYLCPKFDEISNNFTVNGKIYKGTKTADSIAGTDQFYVICDTTPVRLSNVESFKFWHLQLFDLTNPVDAFLLELLKGSDMIAASKAEVNPIQHRYYIEDKEEDARVVVNKNDKVIRAIDKIRSLKPEGKRDFARLVLKQNTQTLSDIMIEAEMLKIAYESPDKILLADEDKNKLYRVLLSKFVGGQIISISGGKFYNGKMLIGINEDFAIEFLKEPENKPLVEQWTKELGTKRKTQEA